MGLENPFHIAVLVVLLLLLFGAKRLPEIGRSLGSGMREFKMSVTGEANQSQQSLPPAAAQQQPVAPQPQQQPAPQAPATPPPPQAVQAPGAEPVATPAAAQQQPPAS